MKKLLLFLTLLSTIELFGQQQDTLRIEQHYYYLADIDPRTIAERFMNDELLPSDNFISFRVLDSLTSTNTSTRKFYLPVFNKIVRHADGALAEVIGSPIIEFLKNYPTEFAHTIKSNELFELYSNFAAYELHFSENYKSDLTEIEQAAKDNYRPYTESELIRNFLETTANKVEKI
ncbi:MAG: hypothetical protein CMB80_09910 [Flammeovirgaceae bacterium]|nr:hypothetical protein [Flammeovirgaceae bacterium]HCX21552.1 hypothetical protein [Cytophagales bacterium]|tara:strand:+ start:2516 stop:3043 length:528 start_codon:yes stop_codon:yes gene_type:complete